MNRICIILNKEKWLKAALGLNTIIFKHVYWYMQQISGERLQDHLSSVFFFWPWPTVEVMSGRSSDSLKGVTEAEQWIDKTSYIGS